MDMMIKLKSFDKEYRIDKHLTQAARELTTEVWYDLGTLQEQGNDKDNDLSHATILKLASAGF